MKTRLYGLAIFLWGFGCVQAGDRPNVLFIAVDDLRPELACYGASHIHSPNIDRLAATGVAFQHAYCMVPTCGASRASLMTGIRPTRTRFVNYLTWAEKDAPDAVTLNTHFRNHGYYTVSLGKVFHHRQDHAEGWSEPAWRPQGVATYQKPLPPPSIGPNGQPRRGPPFESADVPDEAYQDGLLAQRAVSDLKRLSQQDQPFFLAVGFMKPHLPFVAPKKYWDLYNFHEIQLPVNKDPPRDAPPESLHNSGELRAYAGVPPTGPIPEQLGRQLIHGYYACVSYTDAQIGKLLDELDRLNLTDSTIVVLWGDHGWNLGEHTLWCKHCCYETSMRAPLIVRAPGIARGQQTLGLTEFIDIYPSLCELARLELPPHLQGQSFVARLKDPSLPGKDAAIGRYRNGDTIRTEQFRFSEYTRPNGEPIARMLYDHTTDPGETANLVDETDEHVVRELTGRLHEAGGSVSQNALE